MKTGPSKNLPEKKRARSKKKESTKELISNKHAKRKQEFHPSVSSTPRKGKLQSDL